MFYIKTIFVDDEIWAIKHFREICEGVDGIDILGEFRSPLAALEFAQNTAVDLVFLDMEMPQMNGLQLGEKLRALNPGIIVVFVSAHEQYMPDAFRSRIADYYILKPYTRDDVLDVLARAKLLSPRIKKRVRIQTFGRFEVYVDERPLYFSSAKAKELLAVLVDHHGGRVDSEEAFSLLWENRPYNHAQAGAYRHAVKDLKTTLRAAGIEDIIFQLPRGCAVNPAAIDSDYFDFLDNRPDAMRRYTGEYMANYSWGEFRIGTLNEQKDQMQTPHK